jgi:hypothetical protein
MKMIFAGLAAVVFAGGVAAQTVTPVEPPPPAPVENAAPAVQPAPENETAMLTERDGKWWKGDREATREEIKAFKKAQQPK